MIYTVAKLAKLSGVSVRTLHWYDELGLLKPAYYGTNGYRYYKDEQLLLLQQILFFRELGVELKQIQQILGKSDFDIKATLISHRKALQKNCEKTIKLIETIDKTIQYLKGDQEMKAQEMFFGFSKEKQQQYENQIIERFGEQGLAHIEESKTNAKRRSKEKDVALKKEFEDICQELTRLLEAKCVASSTEVQNTIRLHYHWLKHFWTPNKESYAGHGRFIVESELRKAYEVYHPQLPELMAEGIEIFANKELK